MSNEPRAGKGIDPETLAAYMDNRLSPEQRAVVEAQLARDPDSYAVLADTLKALDDEAIAAVEVTAPSRASVDPKSPVIPIPLPAKRAPMLRWAIAGGVLAAAAAVALVFWTQPDFLQRLRNNNAADPLMARLVEAVGEERYIEPRLTGGFRYGPLRQVTRGPEDLDRVSLALLAVAGELQRNAQSSATAGNLHKWGVALSTLGRFDEAIDVLNKALALEPSATVTADLASAHFARGVQQDKAEDLALSLELSDRALQQDPSLAEALFNKALILERFNLRSEARAAWENYLRVDPGSPWAVEARRHLEALPISSLQTTPEVAAGEFAKVPANQLCAKVETDGQLARELVEDHWLPAWGDSILRSRAAEAQQVWEQAERVSACLAQQGDTDTANTVAAIARATGAGRTELARAHVLWRDARAAYSRSSPQEFGPMFRAAGATFRQHGSRLELWTRQYEIAAHFFSSNLAAVEEETNRLLGAMGSAHRSPLWARLHWNIAAVRFQQARFGEAIEHYGLALSAFERLHELDNAAGMNQSMAEAYGYLGLSDLAWKHHQLSLMHVGQIREYRKLQAVLTSPGYTANNLGIGSTGYHFFAEAGHLARSRDFINYRFESAVGAGRSLVLAGRFDAAQPELEEAIALEPSVSNPNLKTRLGGDLWLALAEMKLHQGAPAESLAWSEKVLASLGTASSEYRMAQLRLLRGKAKRALGDFTGSREELAAGAASLESKRALLQEERQRISYLDRAWDIYAEIVALLVLEQKNPEEALEWVERGRARIFKVDSSAGLLDRESLADGSLVLCFLRSDRGLFAWAITRQGVRFHHSAHTPAIDEIRDARGPLTAATLSELSTEMLEPFADAIERSNRLFIVPDWHTQTVPFAALRVSGRDAPLIANRQLSVVPSVELALHQGRSPAANGAHRSVSVLISAQDPTVVLADLPGARREAAAIASMYPSGVVHDLGGTDPPPVESVISNVDVVHVAMHTVADGRYADGAALMIAAGASTSTLRAESLLTGLSRPPRLVVLAACQTARGPFVRGEVVMNLARPFLIAGVPSVLVTLWDIPDDRTAALMVDFHRGLLGGLEPPAALAAAQRAADRRSPGDSWWSGFAIVSVGEQANFQKG